MLDFDHNATTRPSPAVVEAMVRALTVTWHNPSSVHRGGQAARREVELARQAAAELINARPRELIFTSGGTESINLALRGVLEAQPEGRRVLVTTRVEHHAVLDLAGELEKRGGVEVRYAPLAGDGSGRVDLGALGAVLEGATLASVQWANNETGVVQDIAKIGALCRERSVLLHTDATQWVGKEPADVETAGADLMTFSAHKFHGPKGVGMLWVRRGVGLRPNLHGTQELGRRGGTENVPGIVGAGVACREALEWLRDPGARARAGELRDRLEAGVLRLSPEARVNPAPECGAPRLWCTTNIAFPRLEAEAIIMLLSERGLNASAGAACSSGSLEPSPVLLAMGVPPEHAHGSVRFSISRETTEGEVERAAAIIAESVAALRASSRSLA